MGKKIKMKRVVIISDTHCGHDFGITPPEWWLGADSENADTRKIATFQRELWKFYSSEIAKLKPIHTLFLNGDAVDGKGDRSGGVEQYTTDRIDQARMAARVIDEAGAEKVRVLYGTRYHTGKEEDFEALLPDMVGCRDVVVEGHGFYDINGLVFDVKHKIGSSSIPHGRGTPLMRAWLWNRLWNLHYGRQELAHIIIRSHVHYFTFVGGATWLGVTTPALSYNTSFGVRECEGTVDVGFIVIDVYENGRYEWQPVLAEWDGLKARTDTL